MRPEEATFAISDFSYGVTAPLDRCSACGLVQAQVTTDLVDEYRDLDDPAYLATWKARLRQAESLVCFAQRFVSTGKHLDVGAAYGALVAVAARHGFETIGIDPSVPMTAEARRRGLPVLTGALPDDRVAGPYDLVTAIDVLEHVADPMGLLRAIHEVTRPRGVVILATPDVDSLAARLLGRRWWHYRLAHVSYFSPSTLRRALRQSGFIVDTMVRPTWYLPFGYLTVRGLSYLPGLRRVKRLPAAFDRVTVPLNLRDSLLAVCRRAS